RKCLGSSPSAPRMSLTWLLSTPGWTSGSGHKASSNSSCVTSRHGVLHQISEHGKRLRRQYYGLLISVIAAPPQALVDRIQPERGEFLHGSLRKAALLIVSSVRSIY